LKNRSELHVECRIIRSRIMANDLSRHKKIRRYTNADLEKDGKNSSVEDVPQTVGPKSN